MRQRTNRLLGIAIILALLIGVGAGIDALRSRVPAWNAPGAQGASGAPKVTADTGVFGLERTDGGYYTIVDEYGKPLDYTAHHLYPGDEFITADNLRYQITGVEGDTALARLVGREAEAVRPGVKGGFDTGISGLGKIHIPQEIAAQQPLVGIYHTHSDESYVPSDGAASIYAHGGVFDVGNAFADRLKRDGLRVLHSLRPHDPHDANAYVRSRRTAMELLQQQPTALFDVHRDAAPPNVYYTVVNGQPATKVRFVLGRGNPHLTSNLEFAKQIKASLDQQHPGIVQGILLTQGNFNQDLSPHALLIEVGAQTNQKSEADRGVTYFADGAASVLGAMAGGGPGGPITATERANWTAILWILAVVVAGLAAFLYINAGSWRGAWDNLRGFLGREFGGRIRDRR